MADTKYSEMNVDEERVELTSKKSMNRHRSHAQSSPSTIFSKNKMKVLFTSVFLLAMIAGSAVFVISFRSSLTKKTVVENDSDDAMAFDNSKNEQEFISSDDYNNNNDRIPKLRSHMEYDSHPSVGKPGHMHIYIKGGKERPYQRFQFPVVRFGRNRNPLRGPFLNYMPLIPIYADALTKQTVIQSFAGDHLLPPLMNVYGELFSIAQLIASGHASLSSHGTPLKGKIDMKRYFYLRPLIGDNVPTINPYTGDFISAVLSSFGLFPKIKVHKIVQHLDYPRDIRREQEEEEDDDDCNDDDDYIHNAPYRHKPCKNPKPCKYGKPCKTTKTPRKTTTTTTKRPGGTTTAQAGTATPPGATTTTQGGTAIPPGATTTMPPITSPTQCGSNTKARTPFTLRLFQDEFKNPPVRTSFPKVCRPDGHCMFSYSVKVYDTRLSPFNNLIIECRAKPGTIFITYDGHVPGATFVVPTGHESVVRFENQIGTFFKESFPPCIGNRVGRPFSVHHHGSASAPPYDGWADDETCLNETKEYVYPNNRPGLDWYHDHALHITADNAYYGLAGFYVVSTKKKDGGCGERWNLEDIEEKFLIFQDKALDKECQLVIDTTGVDEISFYGDINLVSGIPFPRMPLDAKTYRFRMLNAAVSRPYLLMFKNEALESIGSQICKVIATDGGYRATPVAFPTNGLLIGVAERYEIVCDFTELKSQTLYLWNGFDDKWMKHVDYFCYSHLLAKLEISATTPNGAPQFEVSQTAPAPERPIQRVLPDTVIEEAQRMAENGDFHREMVFGRSNDKWVINGETWDTFKIAASDIGQNTWELWKFKTGGGWFHPVHVHLVDFYIIKRDRDGGLKTYENLSPKDVLYLGPSQKLWVLIRFGPHKGDYMFHCHNLIHEDNDMMRAFRIIDSEKGLNSKTANEPFIRNDIAKIVYSNWKYTDPMLTEVAAKPTSQMPQFDDNYKKNLLDINIYRIFYPRNETDIPLNGFTNPWKSTWCPV